MNSRLHNWSQSHGADDRQFQSVTEAVIAKCSETHRHYHKLARELADLTDLEE